MLYRQKSKTDIMSMFKSLERNLMVLLCSNYYQDILIETEKIMVMRNKAAGLWIFLTNYSLKYATQNCQKKEKKISWKKGQLINTS